MFRLSQQVENCTQLSVRSVRGVAHSADRLEGTLGGEYRVVDPPRVLEHTWEASWDEAPTIVRYELAPARVGGVSGTRVTVTHTAFQGAVGLALGGPCDAALDTVIGIAGGIGLATRAVPVAVQRALALAV